MNSSFPYGQDSVRTPGTHYRYASFPTGMPLSSKLVVSPKGSLWDSHSPTSPWLQLFGNIYF
ncbi:MAG: hypothetical protein GXO83_05840 [Chlorobi bacterium]|nr:hypothetical protein [Chlorobiota bacterium]